MKQSESLVILLSGLEEKKQSVINEFNEKHKHTDPDYNDQWVKFFERTLMPIITELTYVELRYEKERSHEIKVGDGVTYCSAGEKQACTVIRRTKKALTIRRDRAIPAPNQKCTYLPDPNGTVYVCRWSERFGRFQSGKDGRTFVICGRDESGEYVF